MDVQPRSRNSLGRSKERCDERMKGHTQPGRLPPPARIMGCD